MIFYKTILSLILVLILSISIFYGFAIYDRDIGLDKTANLFINNTKNNNIEGNYYLLDKRLKTLYTKNAFIALFQDQNPSDFCFERSRLTSSDNFNVFIKNCSTNQSIHTVSFGGGWGRGWKITNIR